MVYHSSEKTLLGGEYVFDMSVEINISGLINHDAGMKVDEDTKKVIFELTHEPRYLH